MPSVRTLLSLLVSASLAVAALVAQDQAPPPVSVTPIDAPSTPFPSEAASAGITKFSFIAYGDSRGGNDANGPSDGTARPAGGWGEARSELGHIAATMALQRISTGNRAT